MISLAQFGLGAPAWLAIAGLVVADDFSAATW
jgi:hypothetical protein